MNFCIDFGVVDTHLIVSLRQSKGLVEFVGDKEELNGSSKVTDFLTILSHDHLRMKSQSG